MLSVSIALLIQAVFFGDGGITTFGANCFNMAIVGSIVAHLVYRVIARKTPIHILAPGSGGGLGRLCGHQCCGAFAACELGIQPLFFKDASGTPLYAPYALHIAIPAMMLGHLTFAGIGGTVRVWRSGGVSAEHKSRAAGRKSLRSRVTQSHLPAESGWRTTRPLWIRVALLMLLTPWEFSLPARPGANGEREISPIRRCDNRSRRPRATLRRRRRSRRAWLDFLLYGARHFRSTRLPSCAIPLLVT